MRVKHKAIPPEQLYMRSQKQLNSWDGIVATGAVWWPCLMTSGNRMPPCRSTLIWPKLHERTCTYRACDIACLQATMHTPVTGVYGCVKIRKWPNSTIGVWDPVSDVHIAHSNRRHLFVVGQYNMITWQILSEMKTIQRLNLVYGFLASFVMTSI